MNIYEGDAVIAEKNKTQRIGILGGTFNPIHYGHLIIGENALDQFRLDEVIFLPTGRSPHKEFQGESNEFHRCEMVRRAIAGNPCFTMSDYEATNRQVNYTCGTLDYFHEQYPEADLYFIIGGDSLFYFETWKNPEEICRKATLLAAVRADMDAAHVDAEISRLRKKYHARIFRLDTPNFSVSSKNIRSRIGLDRTVRYLLPDTVIDYIRDHHLYRKMTFEEMREKLKGSLKPSRYQHSLGVLETATELAEIYGCNLHQAQTAALLHDCAKYMPDDRRIEYCVSHGVEVTDAEREQLPLLHAKCGAIMAKEEYGIEDEDVLHAIAVHTTGCVNMNLLDKIIFISDYIEPGRDQAPHLEELRALAKTDPDRTVYRILGDTLSYLRESNRTIDQTTQEAFEAAEKRIREGELSERHFKRNGKTCVSGHE